jgi:GNAT superfamily N-acetyltransferase
MDVRIRPYVATDLPAAVSVLGDAFVTNPTHVAAFGPNRVDQNRLSFRIALEHMFTGSACVAMVDDELEGYCHFVASPTCLPPPGEFELAAARLLKPLGDALPKVVEWFSLWCRLDPEEPHLHLVPIGVSPGVQGQGAGSALMDYYIDRLETEGIAGISRPTNPRTWRSTESSASSFSMRRTSSVSRTGSC